MSHIANDQFFDTIRETKEWASELAEQWTGTTVSKVIEYQVSMLDNAVKENDLELADKLLMVLAETCTKTEDLDEHQAN